MNRTASCIICDEIRTEASGKVVHIGVYQHELIASAIPQSLANLVFVAQVRSPIANPISTLGFRVERPGDEDFLIASREVVSGPNQNFSDSESSFQSVSVNFAISPFEVKQEGSLKVWAVADDEEIFAGGLKISQAKPEQAVDMNAVTSVLGVAAVHAAIVESQSAGENYPARDMLDFISQQIPRSVVENVAQQGIFISSAGPREFRGFYSVPKRATPTLRLATEPPNVEFEVLSSDKYGFHVRFDETKEPVQIIGLEVDAEL